MKEYTLWEGGHTGAGEEGVAVVEVPSMTVTPIPHPLHCMEGGGRIVMNEVEPRRKRKVEGRQF